MSTPARMIQATKLLRNAKALALFMSKYEKLERAEKIDNTLDPFKVTCLANQYFDKLRSDLFDIDYEMSHLHE